MANIDVALLASGYNAGACGYGFAKDPSTGDVAHDDTQAYAVMTAIACDRNAYWLDATVGSDLYQLRSLTTKTPSQAENMTLDALLPLEQANLIAQSPTASAQRDRALGGGNKLLIDAQWTTPAGQSRGLPRVVEV